MTGCFLNKQKTFLSLIFNQPRCYGNSTHLNHLHLNENKPFCGLITLTVARKQALKHKSFKSKDELGIGT